MNDTIVAISTALGVGAISIVRLSGKDAISIVNNCFKGKDLTKVESHTINYGFIKDNDEIIDEVLVSIMRAPKTYTTEDIVEINCHGGIIATNRILETMLNNGARLAEPGEFTKRAFLNGRIDLVESESVMDIIESKTNDARRLAISTLQGNITKLIQDYRKTLKDLLSQIEVNIDYPEYYDIEVVTKDNIKSSIEVLKKDLDKLIKESNNVMPIKQGIKTIILGKPNVGKSSILNKLLNEDKAIVTNIAGTTRDIVEGEINLDGIIINIIDTAGIRSTNDVVESIGVEKSLSLIKDADLVIVVLNNNEKLSKDDKEILEKTKNKERIIVINKVDLDSKINLPKDIENVVYTSTIKEEGIEELKEKIKELFNIEKIKSKDYTYLSNTRQISLAKKALKEIKQAETALNKNMPVDIIEIDLNECFNTLGEIIGETYSDEIIDNLFKNFCVGK
ncbi:MAG: tRNA uridine-5-carboxymethylaminomethyl(34) synthesis GTPase MnmE [Bacilli bacterium]|nr:tRNA uridine-5-carboxymethylaminomethyl(34) synthesis GTPase MnmE [Bacilli bacterium]